MIEIVIIMSMMMFPLPIECLDLLHNQSMMNLIMITYTHDLNILMFLINLNDLDISTVSMEVLRCNWKLFFHFLLPKILFILFMMFLFESLYFPKMEIQLLFEIESINMEMSIISATYDYIGFMM